MKIISIQYLRGIAASVVVLQHASTSMPDSPFSLGFGGWGVDLFFVISGFIMFHTTADDRTGPGEFAVRRLVRIVPMYLLLTSVAYALAIVAPSITRTFSASFADYVRSILFIPFFNSSTGTVQPILGIGWTLNYEMFFYLLFAAALVLPARKRLAACWIVLGSLAMTGIMLRPAGVLSGFYTHPILIEFASGMLIASVARTVPASLPRVTIVYALLGIGAVLMAMTTEADVSRAFIAGSLAAALLAAALWAEATFWKPASALGVLVGDSSYSMYLSHGFVLAVLWRLAYRITGGWDSVMATLAFMGICLLAAIGVGILLYRYVEYPIGKALHRISLRPRIRVPVTAVVKADAEPATPLN